MDLYRIWERQTFEHLKFHVVRLNNMTFIVLESLFRRGLTNRETRVLHTVRSVDLWFRRPFIDKDHFSWVMMNQWRPAKRSLLCSMIVWNYSLTISCKLDWLIKPKKFLGQFFECLSCTHTVWVIQDCPYDREIKFIKNLKRQCVTSDLSERFSDFKSIKKVIQQYFKLNRNVIEIILETLESYAQDRDCAQKA